LLPLLLPVPWLHEARALAGQKVEIKGQREESLKGFLKKVVI